MNIANEIRFNKDKPFVLGIRNTETASVFAVGLIKEQVMPKHRTQTPTLLIVLQGSILFRIHGEEINLSAMDTYQIPVDTDHDVVGMDERNIFLLTKEKS